MTKLLQASALAILFIFLAACGDESATAPAVTVSPSPTPTETPLPTAAPEPTSTARPTAASIPAPTQSSIPRPTGTPTPSPTPGVARLSVAIDDETTWRELFDTLAGSERDCVDAQLGDDLERLLDIRVLGEYSSQDTEFQVLSCLDPETARGFFVAGVLSDLPLEIDPDGSEISCIEELVADKDIVAIRALSESGQPDESVMLELSVGVLLCIPELLMTFVGADPSLLSEEEFECVQAVFQKIDAETLTAWVVPDPYEVPAKAIEFAQSLAACAPDLFEGEYRVVEPGPADDHPDWPDEGTPLARGEMTRGVVDNEFDYDYFIFEAIEGETYQIHVIRAPENPGVVPDVAISPRMLRSARCALETDGEGGGIASVPQALLKCAFESSSDGNAIITWTALTAGQYIIEIQKRDARKPVQYSLIITGGNDVPTLTGDEIETVESIIGNDAALLTMDLGHYEVANIGPWVSGDRRPIGAIAELVLENPAAFRGKLPAIAFEPDETTGRDYQQGIIEIHAEGIRSLTVLVDLSMEAVVGVEVDEADSFVIVGEPQSSLFQPLQDANQGSILAMTQFSACALQSDGSPLCWNYSREVEPVSPDVPPFRGPISPPPEGESFVSITGGSFQFCGLREDGTPVCWMALPDSLPHSLDPPPEGERFSYIDSRDCYTCGLLSDGTPLCWAQIRGETHCQDYELAEPPAGERFVALTGYGAFPAGCVTTARSSATRMCRGYPREIRSCFQKRGKGNGSVPSAMGAGASVLFGRTALPSAGTGTWYPTTMCGLMWTPMWET